MFDEIINKEIFGNSFEQILFAILFFLLSMSVLKFVKAIVLIRLKKVISKTTIDYDDLVFELLTNVFKWQIMIVIAVNIAATQLDLVSGVSYWISVVTFVLVIYYVAKGINEVISFISNKIATRLDNEDKKSDASLTRVLSKVIKGIVWVVAMLSLIQNLGFDISGLAAGIGVSGIVLAFALQSVLEDLFSSISIQMDQPFQVGDFVQIGEDKGTVKSIGLKSSRITTLGGDELVISNKELISSRIRNFRKMTRRRVVLKFGVTYNTPAKKLKKINEIVEKIISKQEDVEFINVYFKELGDFSLNYGAAYYVTAKSYEAYATARQNINLELLEKFEKEKIEFAYPTQTVIMEK